MRGKNYENKTFPNRNLPLHSGVQPRRLRPAREFMRCTGKPLYCGEFGVISLADENAASKWIHDLVDVLRQMKIGYAYWCYKVRDFGLVDRNSKVLKPELAKTLFE